MMSVREYAEDINRDVSLVLEKCLELDIDAKNEDDMLDEEAIIMLDNSFDEVDEELEDEKIEEEALLEEREMKSVKPEKKKNKISKDKTLAQKKKEMYKNKEKLQSNAPVENENVVLYKENMTIAELAKAMGVNSTELIKKLFSLGFMVNVNSAVSFDQAEILVLDYGKELKKEETANVANFEEFEVHDKDEDLVSRPPVVTIMGHVDHGKTTLLDAIRKTNVALGEAGGITQAISAYQVKHDGKLITFIDTPGHAAFTEMRARGASITDIVIIIVAADDGVMPQTREAIDHAKAAKVPIIVAINKMDKPGANPDRVMTEMADAGLMPEEWGGDIIFNKISAVTGDGIGDLLENILLIADVNNYRANPNRYAIGTALESKLDKHLGPTLTVLVQNGTLRLGDPIVVGTAFGKVRTLKNDKGEEITEALPSQPVAITGLNDVPAAGDRFMSFATEKEAKNIASIRKEQVRVKENNIKSSVSLDDLFAKIGEGLKEINEALKHEDNVMGVVISGAGPSVLVISHGNNLNKIRETVSKVWLDLNVKSKILTLQVEEHGAEVIE